jgi:hypothetical protein
MKRRSRRNVYLLTNRRAIVWTKKFFGRKKEVYLPTQLVQLRSQGSWLGKGVGDVIFKTIITIRIFTQSHGGGRGRHGGFRGTSTSTSRTVTHYGFLAVENYQKVEKLIRETLVDKVIDKFAQLNQIDD